MAVHCVGRGYGRCHLVNCRAHIQVPRHYNFPPIKARTLLLHNMGFGAQACFLMANKSCAVHWQYTMHCIIVLVHEIYCSSICFVAWFLPSAGEAAFM